MKKWSNSEAELKKALLMKQCVLQKQSTNIWGQFVEIFKPHTIQNHICDLVA